ncbi:MAG: hemerythrin domain-containing protein [Nitrospiraceae bacterium]
MARFGLRNSKANAGALLHEYHRKLENLFGAFEKSKDKRAQKRIVSQMLGEVRAHASAKEKLFFAALSTGSGSKEMARLVDEALEEGHVAGLLMSKVEALRMSNKRYTEDLATIAESIQHHVREQEKGLFRTACTTKLALARLGQGSGPVPNQSRPSRMARRKAMAQRQ